MLLSLLAQPEESMSEKFRTPEALEPISFTSAAEAIDRLIELYDHNTAFLRSAFSRYLGFVYHDDHAAKAL